MSRLLKLSIAWSALAVLSFVSVTPARASDPTVDGIWSQLDSTSATPSARREYAAVYDIQRDRYIIFGGFGFGAPHPSGLFLEVRALTLGLIPTWSTLEIEGASPGQRHSPQWGYDPARQRLLIFGGYGKHYPNGPNEYLNDVWELSLDGTPHWTELFPTGTPPQGRLAGASVYDPLRQRFVGFGGTAGLPVDTWELDLSGDPAWVSIAVDTSGPPDSTISPPGGYGMTSIYDILRDRMLIFGGSISEAYFGVNNDVWEFDLGTDAWSQLTPHGPLPSARRTLASIHDPIRDRMVIFGGWDSQSNNTSSFLHDTWALEFSPFLAWKELTPAGDLPIGRDAMAAVHDPISDRMVVFGGWSGNQMLGDTWFLHWGLFAQAPTMTPNAEADPSQAQVEWGVQNVTGSRAAVYRRQAGTPWSSIATIENTGTGTLAYNDTDVTPGESYGYQIAVPSQQGAVFGGEVWVDVPTTVGTGPSPSLAFALHGARPNPVVSRFAVSFSLPSADPAQLEVVDLAGRRVDAREVGSFGAGRHQVDFGAATRFSPGIYFVRLTRGHESRVNRVVIAGR